MIQNGANNCIKSNAKPINSMDTEFSSDRFTSRQMYVCTVHCSNLHIIYIASHSKFALIFLCIITHVKCNF